jgi:hypothetical protein
MQPRAVRLNELMKQLRRSSAKNPNRVVIMCEESWRSLIEIENPELEDVRE